MTKTVALSAAYIGSIVLGIWLVTNVAPVHVGFGYYAPAAVYTVGATLVLRDLVQVDRGALFALALMATGILLSLLISPAFALASAAAFAISETVDLAVFTALRRWSFLGAILLSGAVAIVVDSYLFLTWAFGDLTFLPGQIIGKATATLAGVAVIAGIRWAQSRRTAAAAA